ncbi:MAG: DUF2541 family protein [Bryobacteraceae bacterium]|nr:DUF2541 family protein [Bryobacteraceae bacterium]
MQILVKASAPGTANFRIWLSAALLGVFVAAVAPAQKLSLPKAGLPGEWREIGKLTANFVADHDSILVKGPFDGFRRIKLRVSEADVELRRLVVAYDNGKEEELDVRQSLRAGEETRSMNLKGFGRQSIRKIDLWYNTKGLKSGRATVTVLGLK